MRSILRSGFILLFGLSKGFCVTTSSQQFEDNLSSEEILDHRYTHVDGGFEDRQKLKNLYVESFVNIYRHKYITECQNQFHPDADLIQSLEAQFDFEIKGVNNDDRVMWGAYHDNQLSAFIITQQIHEDKAKHIYICILVINPEFKDIGISHYLIDHLKQNYLKISLDISLDSIGTICFYKKLGFTERSKPYNSRLSAQNSSRFSWNRP